MISTGTFELKNKKVLESFPEWKTEKPLKVFVFILIWKHRDDRDIFVSVFN